MRVTPAPVQDDIRATIFQTTKYNHFRDSDRVMHRFGNDWYAGIVTKVWPDRTFDVIFDDGEVYNNMSDHRAHWKHEQNISGSMIGNA